MTMTKLEAEERAKLIWGQFQELRPDRDGWSLLAIAPSLTGGESAYHSMDGHGHPTCHQHCTRLEALLPLPCARDGTGTVVRSAQDAYMDQIRKGVDPAAKSRKAPAQPAQAQLGAVIVFTKQTSRAEAERLLRLFEELAVIEGKHWVGGKTPINTFDPEGGGPVWYVP